MLRSVRPSHGEMVHACLASSEPDVVAHEGVARKAEHPLRRCHLEVSGGELLEGPVPAVHPVQVPPAVPVGDHMQHTIGVPFGLEERLAPGGQTPAARKRARIRIDRQVGHPQLGVVPWHLGVVPLDPRQVPAVRRDPWRRHEVRARDEHLDAQRPIHGNGDQIVGRLGV